MVENNVKNEVADLCRLLNKHGKIIPTPPDGIKIGDCVFKMVVTPVTGIEECVQVQAYKRTVIEQQRGSLLIPPKESERP